VSEKEPVDDMHNSSEMNDAVDEWEERFLNGSPTSLREQTLELIERDRYLTKLEGKQ